MIFIYRPGTPTAAGATSVLIVILVITVILLVVLGLSPWAAVGITAAAGIAVARFCVVTTSGGAARRPAHRRS